MQKKNDKLYHHWICIQILTLLLPTWVILIAEIEMRILFKLHDGFKDQWRSDALSQMKVPSVRLDKMKGLNEETGPGYDGDGTLCRHRTPSRVTTL